MNKFKIALLALAMLTPTMGQAMQPDSISPKMRQYAPAVVKIGTAAVANAALTEILKGSIHEMRPDRSGNDSWPSRHTSWTFTAASIAAHELYERNGWWVLGAHAVADAMAMQRVYCNAHYPKDVLGGAMVGLASTELGYFVGGLIFPDSRPSLPDVSSEWLPSLDVTTAALFPLSGGAKGVDGRTAIATSIRGSLPTSDTWGLTAAFTLRSMPLYVGSTYAGNINSAGISAGAAWHYNTDSRWGAELRLMPGFTKNFDADLVSHPSWCFTLDITAGAECRLTHDLALGAETGYTRWALRKSVNALTFSIFTRKFF